ncbi:hypothetical protein L1049_014846 [Liquidambar formosana]|uniref:Transposase n=1 Tax=Liquidambar formosana TaxID=63359 RepID=A0AAP0WZA6_LIQFO
MPQGNAAENENAKATTEALLPLPLQEKPRKAHFVDSDWKLHKRILNFCLVENHKGETLGKMMLDGVENFQKAFERLEEVEMNFLSTFREGGSDEEGKDRWKHLGPPDIDDWDKVRVFVKFLKLFYNATLRFSSSLHVTANVFFLELILLQNAIIQMCEKGDGSILTNMAAGMKRKFEKYWGNFNNSNKLLYVAVVLDPRYKLKFVKFWLETCYEANKGKELLKKIKDALTCLYDWYLENNASTTVQEKSSSQTSVPMPKDDEDDVRAMITSQWAKHIEEKDGCGSKSEVDKYLAESKEEEVEKFDILAWWKRNSFRYPTLSKLARDLLALLVSTVASESAFSTGGRIIDPFRSNLSPNMVEALIYTQNSIRASSTTISLRDAMDEVEEYEQLQADLVDIIAVEQTVIADRGLKTDNAINTLDCCVADWLISLTIFWTIVILVSGLLCGYCVVDLA